MDKFLELTDKLHHPEREERKLAVIELGNSEDDRALELLVEATQDDDLSVRYFARKALIKLKNSLNLPTETLDEDLTHLYIKKKIELLSASDLQIRLNAAKIILEIGDQEIIPEIIKLLKEEKHEYVISILLRITGRLGDTNVIPVIEPFLSYANRRIRANAVEALGYIDDKAVMQLITPFFHDPDNRVKANAAHALWKFSKKKTLGLLKDMLKSPEESDRYSAIFVLRELRHINGRKLLLDVMNDENLSLRLRAAHAIYTTDEHLSDDVSMLVMTVRDRKKLSTPRPVVTAQLPILEKDDPQDRIKGGLILYYLGSPGDTDLVATLTERLDAEEDSQMRATLYKTLGRLGGVSVLHRLAAALQDNNPRIRANALEGLAHVRDPRVTDLVIPLLRDPNNRVKANAARVLQNFSTDKVIKHLKAMAEAGLPAERKSAIFMLGEIGEKQTRSFLARLLARKEADYQEGLTRAMTRLSERIRRIEEKHRDDDAFIASEKMTPARKKRLIKNQIELLTDRDFHVRRSAAQLLIKLMDENSVDIVLTWLDSESNPFIKATLVKIAATVKENHVLEALERFLQDDDTRVRANTVQAIGSFETPRVVELIAPMLHDDEERVKINAAMALWKATEKDDFQKLLSTIRSLETSLKTSAASVLEKARTTSVKKAYAGKAKEEEKFVPPILKRETAIPFMERPLPAPARSFPTQPAAAARMGAAPAPEQGWFRRVAVPVLLVLIVALLGFNAWMSFNKPAISRDEIAQEIMTELEERWKGGQSDSAGTTESPKPASTSKDLNNKLERLDELAGILEKISAKPPNPQTGSPATLTTREKRMVDEALELARKVLADDPSKAIDILSLVIDAAKLHPNARNVRYVMGVAYYELGIWGKAIIQFKAILADHPDDTDALHLLGEAYLQTGMIQEALSQSYEKLKKLHPDDPAFLTKLGSLYTQLHLYGDAEEVLRVARAKGAGTEAMILLGDIYLQQGRDREAQNQYESLVEKEPSLSAGYSGLGKVFYKQLMYENAEEQLKKALTINPNDIEAMLTLAAMHLDLKHLGVARKSAEGVLKVNPNEARAHLVLGKIDLNTNLLKSAEHHLNLALDADPENVYAHEAMGDIHLKRRDYPSAFSSYRTARELAGDEHPLIKTLDSKLDELEKKLSPEQIKKPRKKRPKRPRSDTEKRPDSGSARPR